MVSGNTLDPIGTVEVKSNVARGYPPPPQKKTENLCFGYISKINTLHLIFSQNKDI